MNVVQNYDSVQFGNKNVVQAVRTILQRSNAQNGFRTVVLFNSFYKGCFEFLPAIGPSTKLRIMTLLYKPIDFNRL